MTASEPAAEFCPFSCALAPGVTLVEASAGTGKTTALARLVARLVVDPDAGVLDDAAGLPDPRRAVVVTFTDDATAELTTRIRRQLRQTLAVFEAADTDREADAEADPFTARWGRTPPERERARRRLRHALGAGEATVSTIHGFCRRVLERAAFESGEPFRFTFAPDAAEWTRRALADLWHARTRAHPALAAAALAGGEAWALPTLGALLELAARTPRARHAPEPEPLEDALARLAESADALGRAWDAADARALLDAAPWKKGLAPPPGAARAVAAFAASGGAQGADAVWALAGLPERVDRGKRAGKDALAAADAHEGFAACRAAAAALEGVRRALWGEVLREVPARARAARERAGVLTFDDLIARVHDALHDPAVGPVLGRAIRAQAAVALIDEFQDTDPLQEALFRTAFAGRPLVLVGDPKQAIYGFRGADVFAYLGAAAGAARRATLGRNFRSAPALVAAVNAVFARGGARAFVHDGIGFGPAAAGLPAPADDALGGPPLVWWDAGALDRNSRGLVNKTVALPAVLAAVALEARRLVDTGAAEPSEMAVLVRSHHQGREVQKALRAVGLSSVASKAGNVLESDEMDALEHVLRAVHAPADVRALRTALATSLWGATGDDLDALTEAETSRLVDGLRGDREAWQRHGVFRAVMRFCARERVEARLLAHPDGERRMTNLRHALELVHDAEAAGALAPDQLLRWVRTRADATFAEAGTTELRLESDAQAVQVATMFACKGLQYRVLFAPVLWDVPDRAKLFGTGLAEPPRCRLRGADGRVETVLDLGSDDHAHHAALAEAERLAEHVRLTYVALTRAERRAYVVWGPISEAHRSGLGYLFAGAAAAGDDPCDGARAARAATAARASLPRATADLRAWIERESLGEFMALRPLPGTEDTPRAALTDAAVSGDGCAGPSPPPPATPAAPRPPARVLSADAAARLAQPARRTSFSAWTAGARAGDAATPGSTAETVVAEAVAENAPASAAPDDAPPAGLAAFARGPAAGLALHAVLEAAAWHEPEAYDDPASTASETVARVLRRHGLAHAAAHARGPGGVALLPDPPAAVRALVARLARTALPGVDVRLADLPADPRRRDTEWRFVLPLRRVAPREMAAVFEAHGDDRLRAYAERLARLAPQAADGLLVGTADFVAQVGEATPEADARRWVLFDWKSNRLGATPAAYTPDALAEAMAAHHYTLQAHLYTLGLHRHLRARLGAAYDPARHLGSIAYVFLRAFDGYAPPDGLGVWTERPPLALLDALDALLVDA